MSNGDDTHRALERGLAALGLALAGEQRERLVRYLDLLGKWNRTYNLVGTREALAMVGLHLLDSLSASAYIKGARVLDVGSGAGLPGIPLAIANPDGRFALLDSNAKKARFMRQVAMELALENISIAHCRAERYQPSTGFDTVICRAFASLSDFIAGARRFLAKDGRMLAMKGRLSGDEQQQILSHRGRVVVHRLEVPLVAGERHLVEISWS